ncbi:sugar transferase [Singulisphaera rosea]
MSDFDVIDLGRSHPSVCSGFKRTFDFAAAAVGLVALTPVLMVVGLAVAAALGRPVLFRQVRSGYLGRPFTIYKFRTMRETCRPDGSPLPDAERSTRLGRILRRTSLDELPQLWNVVQGDLSLVGPRPQTADRLRLCTRDFIKRHDVRPGVTGWAQVHGRNAIGWDEKFRLDLWYVEKWSLMLDLKILALTVACVLRRDGIDGPSEASVAPFQGAFPDKA